MDRSPKQWTLTWIYLSPIHLPANSLWEFHTLKCFKFQRDNFMSANIVSIHKKTPPFSAVTNHQNPCPAEPGYTLPLQTVKIQISWLLKKPTDLDLHCLPLSIWIYSNNLDQVIWLAESYKWAWYLNLFRRTKVKIIKINGICFLHNFMDKPKIMTNTGIVLHVYTEFFIIWVAKWEKVPSDTFAQQRLTSRKHTYIIMIPLNPTFI